MIRTLLLSALALTACTGSITLPKPVTPVSPVDPDYVGGDGLHAKCTSPDAVAGGDRLTRISTLQYQNLVHDVLGITAMDAASFPVDPSSGGFDNNRNVLMPTDVLVLDWNRSAEDIATAIATTPSTLQSVAPCSGGQTQQCFNTFVHTTGAKLYRRPLSSSQESSLQTAWTQAGPLYTSGTQYEKAVRMALEAMLQSPAFLYRAELSDAVDSEGGIPLDGYEVAERLSFALWNSGPDAQLTAAAGNGQLQTADGVNSQAKRMLVDPKARAMMRDFYDQWLLLSAESNLSRSATLYPNFNSAMGADMQEETQRFLEDLTFDSAGTFQDIWTSNTTFIDGPLAKLYGINGVTGSSYQKVQLDTTQRAGLLTHTGFLATQSYADIDSPIHRGAYVLKRLMCAQFSPPGGINVVLPPVSATLKTTRERVDEHTANAGCQMCHGVINPVGYSFEHYDAVGEWRVQDNGENVDSSGALPSKTAVDALTFQVTKANDLGKTPVADAIGLSQQLAQHESAQKCFTAMWLRYLYSRLDFAEDACEIDAVQAKIAAGGYSLTDVIADLTSARAFRVRAEVTQ
ncbi:MAG: DUF1592 domain-containing protein [Myxococcaceae bacterium]